jgi:hypothetical protein
MHKPLTNKPGISEAYSDSFGNPEKPIIAN